jgi:hypothetical protein
MHPKGGVMNMAPMIRCCWCGNAVLIDEAAHADTLVGNFCSEVCVVSCFRSYPHLIPFPESPQLQMGFQEGQPAQHGTIDRTTGYSELGKDGDWR